MKNLGFCKAVIFIIGNLKKKIILVQSSQKDSKYIVRRKRMAFSQISTI
jgi:hypothetical protein